MPTQIHQIKLSRQDWARLKNAGRVAQAIEDRWSAKVVAAIRKGAKASSESLPSGGEIVVPPFEKLFMEHYFQTQIEGFRVAQGEQEMDKRLAAKTNTLKKILELYDKWKKGLYKPKGVAKQAESIKRAYMNAITQAWERGSEAFRSGDVYTQEEVKKTLAESTGMSEARANTIVRTSTTRYYTDARKAYYDEEPDVTHYLFLAVRDKATTKWCTSQVTNGLRGRSGLVYAKDDPLLESDRPPCHWNCRSELLPLNRFTPSHQRLIADKSIQRRNVKCHPLPPEWNK